MTTGFLFVVPFAIGAFFVLLYFLIQIAAAVTFFTVVFVRYICKEIAWGVRRAHRWLLTRG